DSRLRRVTRDVSFYCVELLASFDRPDYPKVFFLGHSALTSFRHLRLRRLRRARLGRVRSRPRTATRVDTKPHPRPRCRTSVPRVRGFFAYSCVSLKCPP